jgi:tRNA pseudouridine65 synthase
VVSEIAPDTAPESLPILYQDQRLVIVDKPSGLLVHRSPIDRHETRFALQILRDQLGQRVYTIHRLDKGTSGVLAFGLNPDAAREYSAIFAQRGVVKTMSRWYGWPAAGAHRSATAVGRAHGRNPPHLRNRKRHFDAWRRSSSRCASIATRRHVMRWSN